VRRRADWGIQLIPTRNGGLDDVDCYYGDQSADYQQGTRDDRQRSGRCQLYKQKIKFEHFYYSVFIAAIPLCPADLRKAHVQLGNDAAAPGALNANLAKIIAAKTMTGKREVT
jgi:hypothetical protein